MGWSSVSRAYNVRKKVRCSPTFPSLPVCSYMSKIGLNMPIGDSNVAW
jgi:hypothetical protein